MAATSKNRDPLGSRRYAGEETSCYEDLQPQQQQHHHHDNHQHRHSRPVYEEAETPTCSRLSSGSYRASNPAGIGIAASRRGQLDSRVGTKNNNRPPPPIRPAVVATLLRSTTTTTTTTPLAAATAATTTAAAATTLSTTSDTCAIDRTTPSPVAPTAVAPTAVAPTAVAPTAVAPTAVASSLRGRTPLQARDGNVVSPPARLSPTTLKAAPMSGPKPTTARMPAAADRGSATAAGHHHPRQPPQTPQLSSAVARAAAHRTPLTPKIAVSSRASTPQQQQQQQQPHHHHHHHHTLTVTTPLPRRPPRPESVAGGGSSSSVAAPAAAAAAAAAAITTPTPSRGRDDVASPVSAFLNSNVTPRSGSRQSRIDSTSTTPTGTPNPERSDAHARSSGLALSAASGLEGDFARRPAVSFAPSPDSSVAARSDVDSKFFYASDAAARPSPQQQQQPPPPPLARSSTFFYANGSSASLEKPGSVHPFVSSPGPGSSSSQDNNNNNNNSHNNSSSSNNNNLMSKFIYANGIPDLPPAAAKPPLYSSPGPASTVSTSSRAAATRSTAASASMVGCAAQRPASPVKLASSYSSSHKNATTPSLTSTTPRTPVHPSPTFVPQIHPSLPHSHGEQQPNPSSAAAAAKGGHSRTKSLTIADPPAVARILSAHGSQPPSEVSSPSVASSPPPPSAVSTHGAPLAAAGLAGFLQAAEDWAEDDEIRPPAAESSPSVDGENNNSSNSNSNSYNNGLQSPTKSSSSSSQDKALHELVASARRERKVQDLEIRNASLEAINRTLERQMRKQTAELRRYRRLSRSGRLSLGSSAAGRQRVVSDSSSVAEGGGALARAGLALEDLSEEDDDEEDESEYDDEQDDSYDSESEGEQGRSPGSLDRRRARQRERDEARLQLDLSKHQQLLVDSQKMNQSLKRCLGWTEELIREGRRALQYQVRVSEVRLGGRVLAPEEIEDQDPGGSPAEGGDDDEVDVVVEEVVLSDSLLAHPSSLAADHRTGDGKSGGKGQPERASKEPQDRDSGIDIPGDDG